MTTRRHLQPPPPRRTAPFLLALLAATLVLATCPPALATPASPQATVGSTIQVAAPVLTVRSGPATSFPVVGRARSGMQLQVVAVDSSGDWLRVCCVNGKQGWLQGGSGNVAVVRAAPAAAATTSSEPVLSSAQTVNLRSGPGTAFDRVGSLAASQQLRIVGKNEDASWWQVETGSGQAWVAAAVVRTAGPVGEVSVAQNIPQLPAPAAAASQAPRGAPAPGFFAYGIQINPDSDLGGAIGAVQGLGFNWVKFQLPWLDFEGQPGQRNWPDDKIDALSGAGLSILASIVKAPAWARPANTDLSVEGPPADPATYASFVGEFASRYCGRVQAVEVWNEQNLWYEWGNEPLDAARYVRLLAAAYRAIKAGCPSMIVVSGAPTPTGAPPPLAVDDFTYLERMYQAGLRDYSDAIGAHPSGFNVAPDVRGGQDACNFIRQQGSLYTGPCDSPHHSWSFLSTLEGYRSIMVRYGDGGKRIWPTEFGWASGWTGAPGYEYANDNTLDEQAAWTVRAYQIMKDLGYVGPAFLWNLNYGVSNPGSELAQWGILGRPVYGALQAMPK